MATYAGYLMTPEMMLAWLRNNHPGHIDEKTAHQEAFVSLFRRTKELGFSKYYYTSRVIVPQADHYSTNFDRALDFMGFMFIRQREVLDRPVWLPPRTVHGKNDVVAEKHLRKHGFNTTGWVVIFEPEDNPEYSFYVHEPKG